MVRKFLKQQKKRIGEINLHDGPARDAVLSAYTVGLKLYKNYDRLKEIAFEFMDSYIGLENLTEKEQNELWKDILWCRIRYGIIAKEYFAYRLDYLSDKGRKLFISSESRHKFYRAVNNKNYMDFLDKKTETGRLLGEFYYRDYVCVYDETDFDAFREFVGKQPRFIYKPVKDFGGHGIKIFDSTKYKSIEELFRVIIFNGPCICEELIVQGEEIAKLHPESVNTIRTVTYLDGDGEVHIQWCFLRMGVGESHTDNMTGGGISAFIDFDSGVVVEKGRNYKREEFIYHPDSGVQLIGLKMPEWDQFKERLTKMARALPQIRLVGWDLAYTDRGWVLVEGNAHPACVAPQVMEYRGRAQNYQAMVDLYQSEQEEGGRNE